MTTTATQNLVFPFFGLAFIAFIFLNVHPTEKTEEIELKLNL